MGAARPAAFIALLAVMAWRPAIGDDLPAAPPAAPYPQTVDAADTSDLFDPQSFQFRFGTFAHGVGGVEQGTYDISPELVLPKLPFGQGRWWDVLIPRAHVGSLINLEGRTSSVYAGGLWTFPLPYRFFAELFLDAAKHDGYLANPPPGRSGLGCSFLFHAGGSLGYKVSEHWSAMFSFEHESNGHGIIGTQCDGDGSNTHNPGFNNYGLRLGYAF